LRGLRPRPFARRRGDASCCWTRWLAPHARSAT
jgi:hypothetical protein